MCGRFTLRARLNRVLQEMGVDESFDWSPRYNIAPTQLVAAVRFDEAAQKRVAVKLRWGLVPSWAQDLKKSAELINARAETVAEKPSFRTPFRKRRCLILGDGYYEWQPVGKIKQPYFIHRTDDEPFAMAGLWECWHGGEAPVESCTIITTDANEVAGKVHIRMPVILAPDAWERWLMPTADVAALQELLRPAPNDGLEVRAVSTLVNSPRNDVPACVDALAT